MDRRLLLKRLLLLRFVVNFVWMKRIWSIICTKRRAILTISTATRSINTVLWDSPIFLNPVIEVNCIDMTFVFLTTSRVPAITKHNVAFEIQALHVSSPPAILIFKKRLCFWILESFFFFFSIPDSEFTFLRFTYAATYYWYNPGPIYIGTTMKT